MADTITEWQKRQFNAYVIYQYQQEQNLVSNHISAESYHGNVRGNLDSFDIAGPAIGRDKVDRYEETVWSEILKSRRWARPYRSYAALPFDRFDQVRAIIEDVNAVHTKQIVRALKRIEDKRVIDALNGTALTGETATGTSALPSSQQVAIGTSPNDVLTLAKIKTVSALFDKGSVPPDASVRHWFYAPGQKPAILAITQAASSDFTNLRIYDRGNIDGLDWMGFMWHMIPDVQDQTLTYLIRMLQLSGTTRTNIAFHSSAMGVSKNLDIKTELDYLPQRTYTWQAYGEIDLGAVRVLDGGCATIACKDE